MTLPRWSDRQNGLPKQYAQLGACIAQLESGGELLVACALEAQYCEVGKTGIAGVESVLFVSSRELAAGGNPRAGASCLEADGNDPTHYVNLGRCGEAVDEYVCTSAKENCKTPAKFQPYDNQCTLLADLSPSRIQPRSFFASCQDTGAQGTEQDIHCLWSSTECKEVSPQYIAVGAMTYNYNMACPCEVTEIGACKARNSSTQQDEYFCAVSATACDDESEFIPMKTLQETVGIDCRLCAPPTRIPEAAENTDDFDVGESEDPGGVTTESSSNTSKSTKKIGSLVGGLSAGVVAGVILAIFVTLSLRRYRTKKTQKKSGTAIVVELAGDNTSSQTNADVDSMVS